MTIIRTHDFHRADTLERQHIRTFNAAFDAFARHGSVGMSTSLRKTTQLNVSDLHEISWREITDILGERPYLATFNLDPFHGVAILSLSLNTANRMLDYRLGGGTQQFSIEHFNMTDTDFAIMESTINPLLAEFAASLSRMVTVTATLMAQESNTQFMQLAAANEMYLVAQFDLVIADDPTTQMVLALPFALVRQAVEAAHSIINEPESPTYFIDETVVLQTRIDTWLEVPPIQLPPSEVAGIKVGDVIRFHHPLRQPLDVRAEGVLVARAKRGLIGSRVVCSILEEVSTNDA